VRAAACENLEAFGIAIDAGANATASGPVSTVSTSDSRIKVLVIATDEELCIAQDTARLTATSHE